MHVLRMLLLGSLAVPAIGCRGKPEGQPGESGSPAAIGTEVPRFTGKTIDGEYVQLADYRGQVVLVNVWATWCKPCRQELPELAALHRGHASEGFTVVGVSVDKPQALNQVRALARQFRLEYPIVFDPGGEAVSTFDITGYPTSFLLGRDGRIRWRRNGLIRPNDSDLEAALKTALAQAAP